MVVEEVWKRCGPANHTYNCFIRNHGHDADLLQAILDDLYYVMLEDIAKMLRRQDRTYHAFVHMQSKIAQSPYT